MFADNLNEKMPLIKSGDVVQTPWVEGQTVRHLEPLGFIKFDILGLASLRMIEGAIEHILKRHHNMPNPSFADIKKYYKFYYRRFIYRNWSYRYRCYDKWKFIRFRKNRSN